MLDCESEGSEDVHPLDRDYTTIDPKPKWSRFSFKNKGFALGAVGFGLAALFLILGVVADQLKSPTNSMEDWGGRLHQVGSYCILAAGLAVLITQRRIGRLDKYVSVTVGPPDPRLTIIVEDWLAAVDSHPYLFVEEERIGSGESALGYVYLVIMGKAISQLHWSGGRFGVVNVCYKKKDEALVLEWMKPMASGIGTRFSPLVPLAAPSGHNPDALK